MILVLRLSALGDVIHTIPAVTRLPADRVSWVVEAPYRELVEIVAGVRVIPVRMKQWVRSPMQMRDAIRAMRGAETSIDFQGLIKSAMLGWLSGAKDRIGFAREAIRERPALLFTNRKVRVDTTKHVVDQNLELIGSRATGQPGNWATFPVDMPRHDVIILPGAGKPDKLWPAARWREVARRTGALIAWGPGEEQLARAISDNVAPPTTLRELAGLLRNAALVIGGDTGPLHLAAAMGTRVIGLYGPTDPRRNGPYGQLEHCVDEFHRTKCMDSISVETVMNLVERVAAE